MYCTKIEDVARQVRGAQLGLPQPHERVTVPLCVLRSSSLSKDIDPKMGRGHLKRQWAEAANDHVKLALAADPSSV